MSKKTFMFVTAVIGGIETIAIGAVSYYVEDNSLAMQINGAIAIVGTAVEAACAKFVKE